MVTGYFRGHPILWIEESDEWLYQDTQQLVSENRFRPCGKCGKSCVQGDGDGEVDPCLGVLPGVSNACCGHGIRTESYIQFENGVRIAGFDKVERDKGYL